MNMSSDPLVVNDSEKKKHDACNVNDVSTSTMGNSDVECLFCLESAFESCDLESQHGTKTIKQTVPVNNFATIFPCACTVVHAHGPCLQQWLSHEQVCPLCKQSLSRNPQSLRPPTIVTEFVNFSDADTTPHASCMNIKHCSYCCIMFMMVYLLWGSNIHIS